MSDRRLAALRRAVAVNPGDVESWAKYATELERLLQSPRATEADAFQRLGRFDDMLKSVTREQLHIQIKKEPQQKIIRKLRALGFGCNIGDVGFHHTFEWDDAPAREGMSNRYRIRLGADPTYLSPKDADNIELLSQREVIQSGPHTHGYGEKIERCTRCVWINRHFLIIERYQAELSRYDYNHWKPLSGSRLDAVIAYLLEIEPVEAEPVEMEPVEAEPVETEPDEAEPVETEPDDQQHHQTS